MRGTEKKGKKSREEIKEFNVTGDFDKSDYIM
jgi:hypothetical protein